MELDSPTTERVVGNMLVTHEKVLDSLQNIKERLIALSERLVGDEYEREGVKADTGISTESIVHLLDSQIGRFNTLNSDLNMLVSNLENYI